MKTIKFYTLGCKVNQYDTQSIRERFLEGGFKEPADGRKADVYLINTCTVTSNADQKSRGIIRRCISDNPKAKVIVTGCMVKRDSVELSRIKGIGLIVSRSFFNEGVSGFCGHTRAFLKIQDGCDNFCSYCKVPLVRGRSRSRPPEEVIREAKALVKNGFKEIVLTGICLGSYGKNIGEGKGIGKGIDLVRVITELEKIKGLLRIRLSSIEAKDVTDSLINKMAKSKKLCRHLHIPIQSGDDEILKKMRRKYTRNFYISLINRIKSKIPAVAITTDCLVGFPGEGESHFRNTLKLLKRIGPLKTHIFPYSKREGTTAALGSRRVVDPLIIKKRIAALRRASDICARNFKNRFLGRKIPVLFEGKSKEKNGHWEGYTDNYIKVLFKSEQILKNKLVLVRLTNIA